MARRAVPGRGLLVTRSLDAAPYRPYLADMEDESAALREALEAVPTSIRRLAEEAGVDEKLLRMIRDGDRRLTPSVRDALLGALRRWEEGVGGAIEALEAVEPEGEGGDDGQQ